MRLDKLQNLSLVIVLAFISISIYSNSLNGDFLIDDISGIVNNERLHNPREFFSKYFSVRPGILLDIVYVFNWYISKGTPFFFHLFNILVYTVCVILIFVLCNILFNNRMLSFLSSLIFAVHPIHTEAVSWISGGSYALSSMFFIIAFIFYIDPVREKNSKLIKSNKSMFNLTLAVLFFALCFFSGNTFASLPIMFILYEIFFRKDSPNHKALKTFRLLLLFLISLTAFILVGFYLTKRNEFMHLIFYFRGFKYLIVAAKAFVYYLGILYLPIRRGLYHPFAFDTTGIQELSPALFVSIAIFIIAIFFFFRLRFSFRPVSFGIMWFLATYLPYSNVIPICNIVSERYLYLPSVGFSIIVAALFLRTWEIINRREYKTYKKTLRYLSIFAIVLYLSSYTILTIKQNYEYNNIINYWKTNIRNFPNGHIFYNNLAGTFYVMGDLDNAIAYCWINLMIDPKQPHVWCNLGRLYREKGNLSQAKDCYQNAVKIDKTYYPAYKALEEIKVMMNE
jgi:tetratricopeptide (TPR) repeat protein